MRAVIDANVLISATFWPGKPKQLLNHVRRGKIIFLTSEILLAELAECVPLFSRLPQSYRVQVFRHDVINT